MYRFDPFGLAVQIIATRRKKWSLQIQSKHLNEQHTEKFYSFLSLKYPPNESSCGINLQRKYCVTTISENKKTSDTAKVSNLFRISWGLSNY